MELVEFVIKIASRDELASLVRDYSNQSVEQGVLVDKLREALQDAADNYVTVVCNSQNRDPDEVKSDPVVRKWYEAIAKARGRA